MATTGLEVFDRTLHTTNLWLDEISAEIGPDRHLAWHVLGAVLRSIRDEMLVEQSAHFAAQLPLLVRGAYFDQYRPAIQPASGRSQEEFIARIQHDLHGTRPVEPEQAISAVTRTLNRHVTEGQVKKVRDSLPKGVRALWPEPGHDDGPGQHQPQQQASAQQHASASQQSASQSAPSRQTASPRPAATPQHSTSQQSLRRPVPDERVEIVEERVEMIKEADDEETSSSTARSSSRPSSPARSPQGSMGGPSRPPAVQAPPGTERTQTEARKTKTRTKRSEGE